jgi:hypothetical protein
MGHIHILYSIVFNVFILSRDKVWLHFYSYRTSSQTSGIKITTENICKIFSTGEASVKSGKLSAGVRHWDNFFLLFFSLRLHWEWYQIYIDYTEVKQ